MAKQRAGMRAALSALGQGLETVERLYDVAQPSRVFGEPAQVGEHTLITCSEVWVGLGFGLGGGGPEGDAEAEDAQDQGEGAGGGGGGGAGGRPVAVIDVGPQGVSIQPVFDLTKVAIAFAAALGSLLAMRRRMGRMR